MRALVLTRRPAPGGLPDALEMADVPAPVPSHGEALVRVFSSTINIDDIHVAEGTFYGGIPIGAKPTPKRPVTPGSDLAGIVTGVGSGVHSVHPGQAVFGIQIPFHARGAWEELCAIDERWLTTKPEGLSFNSAAACGISGLVALSAIRALKLDSGAHVSRKRTLQVVVVGATGGIGAMAVQLAARAGANVIGICGPAHMERARELGCSLVLDYKGAPWTGALKSRGLRIDRVLDTVGGRDVENSARNVLSPGGIFVTVVGPQRFIGDRPLPWTEILGIIAHAGYRMGMSRIHGPRYVLTGPSMGAGKMLGEVAAAASSGVVPPIDSTVPFELGPVCQALRRAAAHQNNGRIVIQLAA